MKIVDVSEHYAEKGGGIRVYTLAKLKAAARLGHKMVIVAPGPADDEQACEGGRIIWVKSPPLIVDKQYYFLLNKQKTYEILEREQPDVVEASGLWTGGWFTAHWPGKALKSLIIHSDVVATFSQNPLGRLLREDEFDRFLSPYWQYLQSLRAKFDLCTVSGAWLRERFAQFGVTGIEVIPFGINKSEFSPTFRSLVVRKELLECCRVPEHAPLLIAVSRYTPEKRLDILIDAIAQVSASQPIGLVIFGDGPLRNGVKRQSARTPGIYLAGRSQDRSFLASALASADAFIHGCAVETYGLVVGEAICSGTPVIVPNRGGAFELAQSEYAEVYAAGDQKSCAVAIQHLLHRDSETLRSAALQAANLLIGTMDDHFAKLFSVYEKQLQRSMQ